MNNSIEYQDKEIIENTVNNNKSIIKKSIWVIKLLFMEMTNSREYVKHIISASENQKKAIDILIDKSQVDYIGENPDLFNIIHHPYIADVLIKKGKTGLLLDNLTLYQNLSFEHAQKIVFLCMDQEYSTNSIHNIIEKHITHFNKKDDYRIMTFLRTYNY